MQITLTLNGIKVTEDVAADMLLIDFVRAHGCKSVKRGCETSNCGLCTVFLDEKPVLSCSVLAARASGHSITTLEGLQEEAAEFGGFIADQGAEQCGFCNPGFIMNALALFREDPYPSEEEVKEYLKKLLHKEAFDKAGLIYGMGHAVYSISDPRAKVFKSFVEKLSEEKGYQKEYQLYANVEKLAPQVIAEERKIYKGVSANVDFYSGFVYQMLGLPNELFTPLFAVARMAGWSAHRLEELINQGKIIRPAYKAVKKKQAYIPMDERE